MGCIRVDKITEYLCDPLLKTLKDEDPYVRKTAAVCVAKLYDINPELVEERGFLDLLRELLGDSNPMVVANAVAALSEVADASGRSDVLVITSAVLFKLLAALNECTEWGQVFILDALAGYSAQSVMDAETVVERVTPRLQHANCAVVLSAVKVVLRQLPHLSGNTELLTALRKKLAPPLVTLLSAEPEIQYVALRNINLIIQRYPSILGAEVKVFFCKYNDPLYVKLEKLDIMVRLTRASNVDAVLLELREYATEVDVDFVRKAVRAVGRAAISLDSAAERCVGVLLDLIRTKVNYVVQEAVVVIRDIFRRYPGRYEGVIATLCECLDTLDEPEAKASMVWIVGEYAERIDNAEELLSMFGDTFEEEASGVQLALLTASVKLFLKKPEAGPQALITSLLGKATSETDNPDLRDRAYIYWRLLSSDPEAARDVVLADKPVIADDAEALEPALLDELLGQLATLSSVYHKPASSFVTRSRAVGQGVGLGDTDEAPVYEVTDVLGADGAPHLQVGAAAPRSTAPQSVQHQPAPALDLMGDLITMSPAPAAAHPQAGPPADLLGDLMGLSVSQPPQQPHQPPPPPPPPAAPSPLAVLLSADAGGGLEVCGQLVRSVGGPCLSLSFASRGAAVLDGFQMVFNKNACGLAPAQALSVAPCAPGALPSTALLPLSSSQTALAPPPAPHVLQVAVKSPRSSAPGVFYFHVPILAEALFTPQQATPDAASLAAAWRALPEGSTKMSAASCVRSAEAATQLLAASNVLVAHCRPLPDGALALYAVATLPPQHALIAEVTARPGVPGVRITVKCGTSADAAALAVDALERLLS